MNRFNVLFSVVLVFLLASCSTLGLENESSIANEQLRELAIPPKLQLPTGENEEEKSSKQSQPAKP